MTEGVISAGLAGIASTILATFSLDVHPIVIAIGVVVLALFALRR